MKLIKFHTILLFIFGVTLLGSPGGLGLHLHGTWNSSEFFIFLARFGIQKTVMDEPDATRGYIYGNITLSKKGHASMKGEPVTLLVVDSDFFLDVYGTAMHRDSSTHPPGQRQQIQQSMCEKMFANADQVAWHPQCNPRGALDLYRSIPCPNGELCKEEDDPKPVQPGYQFTFIIQDAKQPRYWYLMLVSCVRNSTTCKREATAERHPVIVDYDVWLVNGSPQMQNLNLFEHQFSFEYHDTAEMYFVFSICYFALALLYQTRFHVRGFFVSRVLLIHLWLVSASCASMFMHELIFASNGVGWIWLWYFGFIGRHAWADGMFLSLLVIVSHEGFNILHPLTPQLRRSLGKPIVVLPWLPVHRWCVLIGFVSVTSIFHVWCELDQDSVLDVDMWESAPGGLLIALRFCACLWFFYQFLHLHYLQLVDINFFKKVALYDASKEVISDDESSQDKDIQVSLIPRQNGACSSSSLPDQMSPKSPFVSSRRLRPNGISQPLQSTRDAPPPDLMHVAAGYLVWALTLPLSVLVAETAVSALWRPVTVISVTYCGDFMAAIFIIYIFWRNK